MKVACVKTFEVECTILATLAPKSSCGDVTIIRYRLFQRGQTICFYCSSSSSCIVVNVSECSPETGHFFHVNMFPVSYFFMIYHVKIKSEISLYNRRCFTRKAVPEHRVELTPRASSFLLLTTVILFFASFVTSALWVIQPSQRNRPS